MTHVETEIKLAASSAAQAAARLEQAGFSVHHARTFESNAVFDTDEHVLKTARRVLRVRNYGGRTILTYKGAASGGKHKTREELEVEVTGGAALALILERLGYRARFRYEKYRTEYRRPGEAGLATVDETPIGVYIELEGPPEWIDRMAAALGHGEGDYITRSYASLWADYRIRHGDSRVDMIFSP